LSEYAGTSNAKSGFRATLKHHIEVSNAEFNTIFIELKVFII